MKRKTKEIKNSKDLKKSKKSKKDNAPLGITIILTDDQFKLIQKLSIRDSQSSPQEWVKRTILRIAVDRSRDTR